MRIGLVEAVGAELDPIEFSWTSGDVQLYHLGFGPGADPMNARELCYLIDDIPQVLPTFWERHGGELPRNRGAGGEVSGNRYRAERGAASHRRGHRAWAATGHRLGAVGHLVVWDKGKGALIVIETSVTDVDRRGDCNPLHSDPDFAAAAVFLRPILHGLCTYDIRCKAIVDAFLESDVSRVHFSGARFASVVFPGETLKSSICKENDKLLPSITAPSGDNTALLLDVELIPV